ncbi:hypothetical protein F8M41_014788 [Gigaspora margarita]|uniref:Uncharacterized protein n=3 Tax=Gigaspora margarita TaxID=4874 RepID=A0A8H4AR73_GIGMA|nr:hypothetical protein F8M41_014788 [Gigaspora margarita]
MKSFVGTKRGVCLCLSIIPNLILAFLCPVFEIAKLKLFSQSGGEITYNIWIEYTYLALTLSMINAIFLIHCCCIFEYGDLAWYFRIVTIIWLIFPFIYTFLTIKEMGDIPFNCPSDYPYKSNMILAACKVRETNLICMWLYFATLIIIIPLFWSLRNAFNTSPSPDFDRETDGFHRIFAKLRLEISGRQSPRSDLEDDQKNEHRTSVLIFEAESPIV